MVRRVKGEGREFLQITDKQTDAQSYFSNLVVVAVMLLRPQKLRSTHVLIMALAASDIMFSLVIRIIRI